MLTLYTTPVIYLCVRSARDAGSRRHRRALTATPRTPRIGSDPVGAVHRRPVATSLLTAALALAGVLAFRLLPVSPLPQVDFPTIVVNAACPARVRRRWRPAVATPLERQFGRIAGVTEMTSSSRLARPAWSLQFELDRDINAAARDVQAAINAARGQLPPDLPGNPTYRKVNPADAPIAMILSLTSDSR